MDLTPAPRKNPSRKECEEAIKKILAREVLLEDGKNHHFRNASDFMKYFESLYPAGPALRKQVQRAVKAMDMPKDKDGYFIINKTQAQLDQEVALSKLLSETNASVVQPETELKTVFLRADARYRSYLLELFQESETFRGKYLTILNTSEGLLFLTENPQALSVLLESLIP